MHCSFVSSTVLESADTLPDDVLLWISSKYTHNVLHIDDGISARTALRGSTSAQRKHRMHLYKYLPWTTHTDTHRHSHTHIITNARTF